jgi:hypothetical protein
MFIILTGGEGFAALGPYDTMEEACSVGDGSAFTADRIWFALQLRHVAPCPPRRTAKQWRESGEVWVRFAGGGLDEEWEFTGPYDQDRPGDHPRMLQLMPLEQDDESEGDEQSESVGVSQL